MAHGLPDYYRGVDIAYQALSEMIIRPKYGGAQRSAGSGAVTASTLNTLVTVSGKGMLYGGFVGTDYTASQANSVVELLIDGSIIAQKAFSTLYRYLLDKPGSFPLSLTIHDATKYIYCVGISYGLTFETSVTLKYDEKHGGTPDVEYSLIYALI